MTQDQNIFTVIQEQYKIIDVASNMLNLSLKRVGGKYRADSIAPDGGGENALEFFEETNTWYDWKLRKSGDVAQLVADVMFNGDIKQALRQLAPEFYEKNSGKVCALLQAKKDFTKSVDIWHNDLINSHNAFATCARKYLLDRGITLDTIKALKIGIKPDTNSEFRIVFPYWDQAGKEVVYFTSRRFPVAFKEGDEPKENEKSPKYKKASLQQYSFLRNVPMGLNTLPRLGKNEDGTLVITEGVVDWLVFYQEGYSVLAPNGGGDDKFWNQVIELAGKFKRIILAFDKDDAGREFTYKAAKIFLDKHIPFKCADLLTKDVAEYYQATGNLDVIVNSAREGTHWIIDSFKLPDPYETLPIETQRKLLANCKDTLMQIALETPRLSTIHEIMLGIRNYFPKNWIEETTKELKEIVAAGAQEAKKEARRKKKKDEEMRIVNAVIQSHTLLHDPRTGFYEYMPGSGRWKHQTNETIGGYVMRVLGDEATWPVVSHAVNLIKQDERINLDIPVTKFNTRPLLSFLNGTLHIDPKSGNVEMKAPAPTDYNTVQLQYMYNQHATCPNWEKFIDEITAGNKEAAKVLQEFAGYALLPTCKYQSALLLKGGGANGKSVYTDIISAVFGGIGEDGRGYISGVEPSKLKDNFRLMPFQHAFLNISSDTESDIRGGEGVLKKIIAGEVLEDSYKYKDSMPFATRTKLIMCCNNFPYTNDTSDGFMRRFLIIEFPMHYVKNPRPNTNERKLDPNLKDKLMEELPGIFNWVLKGLRRLLNQDSFTDTSEQSKHTNEFCCVNNHNFALVAENGHVFFNTDGTGKVVHRRKIYQFYKKWCDEQGIQPMGSPRFYSNLRGVFSHFGITFREANKMWYFDNNPEGSTIEVKEVTETE